MSSYTPVKGQLIAVEVNPRMRWGLFRLGMKEFYRYGTMRGPYLELWISLLTEGRHPRLCSEEMESHSFMRVFRIRRSCWLRLRRSDFWTTGFFTERRARSVCYGLGAPSSGFHDIIKKNLN